MTIEHASGGIVESPVLRHEREGHETVIDGAQLAELRHRWNEAWARERHEIKVLKS